MKPVIYPKKMERFLHYILDHLDKKITLEDTALYFSYNPVYFAKIFQEYFEIPFQKYINKLKLRKAAEELYEHPSLKTVGEKYGYATTGGFSKAFRKEFGVSPREFIKRGIPVPDMPLKSKISGKNISMEYFRSQPVKIAGYPILKDDNSLLDVFFDIAYGHEHPEKYPWDLKEKTVAGVWWCDSDEKLYYLLGPVIKDGDSVPEKSVALTIPSENYAVFHIEKGSCNRDIYESSRLLAQYISKEWAPVNGKIINYIGYVYEVFDQTECRIYIPLLKGMGGMSIGAGSGSGIDTWIKYIDQHILEDITIRKIASHFHYSPNHFSEIFQMYYNIDLLKYIQKRKLYQIASALKTGSVNTKDIAEKYHFKTYEQFSSAFYSEFHRKPEQYSDVRFDIPNLPEYYSNNKNLLKVSYVYLESINMIGMEIKSMQNISKIENAVDIPALCAYYFRHDFSCWKDTPYARLAEGKEDKIGLWNTITDESTGNPRHLYVLGPVVAHFQDIPPETYAVTIPGGKYAVFETESLADKYNLEDVYKMMTICVLYGWIKEYRVRVDLDRITFMRYTRGKLYTYVPIYE